MILLEHKSPLFSFIFVATLLPSLSLASFPDVTDDHPFSESVHFSKEQDIIIGYPDGTFRPDDLVNRAEFTKILMRYANATPFVGQNCFPEVNNEWFAQYVCSAQKRQFLSGYPDGTFRPGNSINFAEVSKIIVRSLNIAHEAIPEGEEWFVPFIKALDSRDAIPSSITSPEQLVTRAELTNIIHRLYLHKNKEVSPTSSPSFDTETAIEDIVISNTPAVETDIDLLEENEVDLEINTPEDDFFTLESEIQLSFSLLNIFEPQKTSHTTLNIDGTEYLLSVEPKFEKYSIESVPGEDNMYKVIRTVDKKTFANSSQKACEKVNGNWQTDSLCLLGSL